MKQVKRTDRDTGEETIISMDEAVKILTGWWTNIEELLNGGMELYTPYANYKIIEKHD